MLRKLLTSLGLACQSVLFLMIFLHITDLGGGLVRVYILVDGFACIFAALNFGLGLYLCDSVFVAHF